VSEAETAEAVAGEAPAGEPAAEPSGGRGHGRRGSRTRRRLRESEQRAHRLTPRFSAEELADVTAAAALEGMTPTGYAAKAAVDVARGRVRPAPSTTADALAELLAARAQVRRFGALVNQAVAKLHSTGEVDGALEAAVAACTRAVGRVEDAAVAVRYGRVPGVEPRTAQTRRRPATGDGAGEQR
jgi:hypothetical protein